MNNRFNIYKGMFTWRQSFFDLSNLFAEGRAVLEVAYEVFAIGECFSFLGKVKQGKRKEVGMMQVAK